MKIVFALCLFLLAACASQPSTEELAEEAAEATDACLANPKLASSWGECNVKKTIFDNSRAIGQCQQKHAKPSKDPLMLKIRLKASGAVHNVQAEDGSPRNKALEGCLSREIAKLKFAAPPKGANPVIYFPFVQQ